MYTHLCSASVKVLQGPGHIPGHLQPGLGGEGEGGGEVGIQGPMRHEGVEKTEMWAITAVAQDRQEALVGETGEVREEEEDLEEL